MNVGINLKVEIDSHFLYKIMLLKNKSEKWEQILFKGITKSNIIILRRCFMITIDKKKDSLIQVRLSVDEKEMVTKIANEKGMTTSKYLRTLINKDLEDHE